MNKKYTKSALFGSVIALILCCAMLVGSTFAWFTDSVSTGKNTIQSGNLDISLWHSTYAESVANSKWGLGFGFFGEGHEVDANTQLFLNPDGEAIQWEPGVQALENFRIKNEGSLALKYEFRLQIAEATENPANGKTLADVLTVSADKLTYADNGVTQGETLIDSKLLGDGLVFDGVLLAGETFDFCVGLEWIPTANDNDFNVKGGLKLDLSVALVATQETHEKDGVNGDQYDANAEYPTVQKTVLIDGPTQYNGETFNVDGNAFQLTEEVEVQLHDCNVTATNDAITLAENVANATIVISNTNFTLPEGCYVVNAEGAGGLVVYLDGTVTVNGVEITSANKDQYFKNVLVLR